MREPYRSFHFDAYAYPSTVSSRVATIHGSAADQTVSMRRASSAADTGSSSNVTIVCCTKWL